MWMFIFIFWLWVGGHFQDGHSKGGSSRITGRRATPPCGCAGARRLKQAGMMEHTTSNAAGLRPMRVFGYMYRGVNEVFTAKVNGKNG